MTSTPCQTSKRNAMCPYLHVYDDLGGAPGGDHDAADDGQNLGSGETEAQNASPVEEKENTTNVTGITNAIKNRQEVARCAVWVATLMWQLLFGWRH